MQSVKNAVIRFSGDSGDGMQLTGGQFSTTSSFMGNDIATFPDFPAEIRAPQGTLAGVSGFQVRFGSDQVSTPGDMADVLIAMNPAALMSNIKSLKKGATIIVNTDSFTALNFKKANLESNPLETHVVEDYKIIECPMTTQTKTALEELDLDGKSKSRCKNFYALGMTYYMYSRDLKPTLDWIENKFKSNDTLVKANQIALKAGFNYADTIEAIASQVQVAPASLESGTYRQINGNTALAWGFIHAAEKAGRDLFLGSYPITPASDILHELSKHKEYGVKTFQAEDEIAAICSAIGASFTGALSLTTSSGPGIALKGEALGLAMMYELPLVVVDVQRGGPSTGLPTKTEQSDLNMAIYGRNGESPVVVLAAQSPSDCFHMAYEASRIALEHMIPVILLTDGYIANGSTPWKLPDIDKLYPKIQTKLLSDIKEYEPYKRDPETLVRNWAIPGQKNGMHRLGGLEKDANTGGVSYDPQNHELMVHTRQAKCDKVANNIPLQQLLGDDSGDVLIISWGGTYGACYEAVAEAQKNGIKVSLMHMKYLNPMPKNVETIFKSFKKKVVCELNNGQLRNILSSRYDYHFESYTKIQGQPFSIRELNGLINNSLESIQ